MNSRQKGKVGEREFAALLRVHGFDARRGQQFAGGGDSPDVVSGALRWLHIEVKRVQHLNLAEACAQARRDCGGKPWIVAHRRNREAWLITVDSDALYDLLHRALTYFDLWPFVGPRPITMDAELFFQFLREVQRRRHTDEHGYVLPPADGRNGMEGTDLTPHSTPHPSPLPDRGGEGDGARATITDFGKSSGVSPAVARDVRAVPETEQVEQTEQ